MPDFNALLADLLAEQKKTNHLLLLILSALTEEDAPETDEPAAPQYLNRRGE